MQALSRRLQQSQYLGETDAQRNARLQQALLALTRGQEAQMTDYAFQLKEILAEPEDLAPELRQAKGVLERSADTIQDRDRGSKIATLTTSSISAVGGILMFTPISPVGAGLSVASNASQITATQILEALIRNEYSGALKAVQPICNRTKDFSEKVERALALRDDAANSWVCSPADCTDTAAKIIVAFKVLCKINAANGYDEIITQHDSFRAMLLLFFRNTLAARIVIDLLQRVPGTEVQPTSLGCCVDPSMIPKIGKAILPVVALGAPKALVRLGQWVASSTALTCMADCGTKCGIKLAETGLSSSLPNFLIGVGIVCDLATIITCAVSFNQPHVAETSLRNMAAQMQSVCETMDQNRNRAQSALQLIDTAVNNMMTTLHQVQR
mmetsp:Transcript_145952/g.406580  ORF Transcript_145952/g.406580 Transcript_145952/m.406580 type:complete len:385 (-) Transcript_145952:194-1348(-)